MKFSDLANIRTAVVIRGQALQENSNGNVRALAIRDLVASKPLHWQGLPKVLVEERYLSHCLKPGDVVIPSRGDYYKAWVFVGEDVECPKIPIFPVGQLNVITPKSELDAQYLVWYLNQRSTQIQMSKMLTGTSIKALTKAALMTLEVDVPPLSIQKHIAEIEQITQQISSIRHRMNELDRIEIDYLTNQILQKEGNHA
ncbi:restriction endonuclease subunit S [Vreelandella venusta]|uniref:restriction endonuclease subunit S n=1 Tax=Vreelandella venusta TaxID=44935 RepID=UPI004043F8CE